MVLNEKGISRWGGGGLTHIGKQALEPKRAKLQSVLGREDVLRALSIATESLEVLYAMRLRPRISRSRPLLCISLAQQSLRVIRKWVPITWKCGDKKWRYPTLAVGDPSSGAPRAQPMPPAS